MMMFRFVVQLMLALLLLSAATADANTGMLAVDWRDWLHGTPPPPPPKAPPPKKIAIVSAEPTVMSSAEIEKFLRTFALAVMARDGKTMLPWLSENYAIDGLPADKRAVDFFTQAIERINGAEEIIIKSIEQKDATRIAKIEFRYSIDNIKLTTFRFDARSRLLWSDLFALQQQRHGA